MLKLLRTVGHLTPGQVLHRPTRQIRRRFARPRMPGIAVLSTPRQLAHEREFPATTALNDGSDVLEPRFEFMGTAVSLDAPVDWAATEYPALWRYNLNYFTFLEALSESQRLAVCRDWINSNPPFRSIGWDAYPTSLRIINWLKHTPLERDIVESLFVHTDYLSRFTEKHLLGNHLLENARALVFAGSFFRDTSDGRDWLAQGIGIYQRELPEQILSDGGHFERSPMYHALMLEGVLDVINLLGKEDHRRDIFVDIAESMVTFLRAVTHPDGNISAFNDAFVDLSPSVSALLDYGHRLGIGGDASLNAGPRGGGANNNTRSVQALRDSGYYICRREPCYLIVDAGPLGPDYLPAHGHADIFSYEFSLGAERFVVDTGVGGYDPGPEREYARGTRAHSTVEVDGVDHAELWGSFRVGRRYHPSGVRCESTSDSFRFSGDFAGYRQLVGDNIFWHRDLQLDDARLRVCDTVTGVGDHRVVSRVNLAPAVRVEQTGATEFSLTAGTAQCLLTVHAGTPTMREGRYYSGFGNVVRNTVVEVTQSGELPAHTDYSLTFGRNPAGSR